MKVNDKELTFKLAKIPIELLSHNSIFISKNDISAISKLFSINGNFNL